MVVKSTDMPRVPAHSDSEEPTKGNETAEGNGKGKEEDAESEYEIEEVLDAKRGVFPDVRVPFVSTILQFSGLTRENRVVWDIL